MAAVLLLAHPAGANAGAVEELETAFVQLAARVEPAVVTVRAVISLPRGKEGNLFEKRDPFDDALRRFFGEKPKTEPVPSGLGSGVIFDRSGLVATNEHVVASASHVAVRLTDGSQKLARILGTDPRLDLAVLKIEGKGPFPCASWGDASRVKTGQFAIAFGHPWGIELDPKPTMTVGHVSALNRSVRPGKDPRRLSGLIQTDAPINPGNSGGPLVNLRGEIIGINVAIVSTSGGFQGIAYAVPINAETRKVINKLSRGLQVRHGWLGVRMRALTEDLARAFGLPPRSGVLIDKVAPASPAERAGLRPGDVLLSLDGEALHTPFQALQAIEKREPGAAVQLGLRRGKKNLSIELALGAKDVEQQIEARYYGPKSWRGIEVAERPNAAKTKDVPQGVVVKRVERNSPGWIAGIRVGQIIYEMNHEPVKSVATFRQLADGAADRDVLLRTDDGFVMVKKEK